MRLLFVSRVEDLRLSCYAVSLPPSYTSTVCGACFEPPLAPRRLKAESRAGPLPCVEQPLGVVQADPVRVVVALSLPPGCLAGGDLVPNRGGTAFQIGVRPRSKLGKEGLGLLEVAPHNAGGRPVRLAECGCEPVEIHPLLPLSNSHPYVLVAGVPNVRREALQ